MPLSVGAGVTTPPTPPPPPPPTGPPDAERLQVFWLAPDGTEYELVAPDRSVRVLATNALSAAAPIEHTTDANPRGGVTLRHTQPQARHIILPVHVRGSSHMDLVQRWRTLSDAFTQTEDFGPGILRVLRPDGSSREIEAVYETGWEGIPEYGPGVNWDNAVLTLLCEDPYWRSRTPIKIRREFSDPVDFYDPYASISSGQVLGATIATNPGEARAWPVWRLTGPLTQFTATHSGTGEEFVFDPDWDGDGPLLAGQTATITTDPVQVRGPSGQVWTGAINFPSGVLWALRRGNNSVTFAAAGAAAGTTVELEFHARYRTA